MDSIWKEKLAKAGYTSDGHVTNGSLLRQEEAMDEMLTEFVTRLELIGSQCFNGGHKSRSRMFQALAKSFRWRYIRHD